MTQSEIQKIFDSNKRALRAISRIGRGSFGEVWFVRDENLGRDVAVKFVPKSAFRDGNSTLWQFELKGIRNYVEKIGTHPNLIAILDAFETDDFLVYVMEAADARSTEPYLPDTLHSRVKRGALSAEEVKNITLELLNGLEHLHNNNLQHRDVKLENIVFVNNHPKLADMGGVALRNDLLHVVSTPAYTPPLNLRGEYDPVSHDLYALGKIIWACLTGLSPDEFPALPENFLNKPVNRRLNRIIVTSFCANESFERPKNTEEFRKLFLAALKPPLPKSLLFAPLLLLALLPLLFFSSKPAPDIRWGDSRFDRKSNSWTVTRGNRFATLLLSPKKNDVPAQFDAQLEFTAGLKQFDLEFCLYPALHGNAATLSVVRSKHNLDWRWHVLGVRNGLVALASQQICLFRKQTTKLSVVTPAIRLKSGWNKLLVKVRRPNAHETTVEMFVNGHLALSHKMPSPGDAKMALCFGNAGEGAMQLRDFEISRAK